MRSSSYLITILIAFLTICLISLFERANVALASPTLEDQFGNTTQTRLVHNSAVLVLNQSGTKGEYKIGENITIIPELANVGNSTVEIAHWEPWIVLEIKNQEGTVVWPKYSTVAFIPEFYNVSNISPGNHIRGYPWGSAMSSPRLEIPGNYTIISAALITLDTKATTPKSLQPLWSKPIQIIVLPEKIPEFQTVLPVFVLCIVPAIIFVRIKLFDSK